MVRDCWGRERFGGELHCHSLVGLKSEGKINGRVTNNVSMSVSVSNPKRSNFTQTGNE